MAVDPSSLAWFVAGGEAFLQNPASGFKGCDSPLIVVQRLDKLTAFNRRTVDLNGFVALKASP